MPIRLCFDSSCRCAVKLRALARLCQSPRLPFQVARVLAACLIPRVKFPILAESEIGESRARPRRADSRRNRGSAISGSEAPGHRASLKSTSAGPARQPKPRWRDGARDSGVRQRAIYGRAWHRAAVTALGLRAAPWPRAWKKAGLGGANATPAPTHPPAAETKRATCASTAARACKAAAHTSMRCDPDP
jgi:hypothetical protein